jgi:hypothetical protein
LHGDDKLTLTDGRGFCLLRLALAASPLQGIPHQLADCCPHPLHVSESE